MGVLAIFSTGTYANIGTMCVEPETCYEKYHEKKSSSIQLDSFLMPKKGLQKFGWLRYSKTWKSFSGAF